MTLLVCCIFMFLGLAVVFNGINARRKYNCSWAVVESADRHVIRLVYRVTSKGRYNVPWLLEYTNAGSEIDDMYCLQATVFGTKQWYWV
jgi:hypothetical protein